MTKYNARPTVVDNIRFASKKEAARYCDLKLLQKAGEISELELQPKYKIIVFDRLICSYIADFRYRDCVSDELVVEDVKGVKTPAYRLKNKLMWAVHNIKIKET